MTVDSLLASLGYTSTPEIVAKTTHFGVAATRDTHGHLLGRRKSKEHSGTRRLLEDPYPVSYLVRSLRKYG